MMTIKAPEEQRKSVYKSQKSFRTLVNRQSNALTNKSQKTVGNVLMDYMPTEENEDDYDLIDFEDLVEEEFIPDTDGDYLRLNVEHMQNISTMHIKINIAIQIIGILLIITAYIVGSLVHFHLADNPDVDSYITAWRIKDPNGDKHWYWQYEFDDDTNCKDTGFDPDSAICAAV